MGNTGSLSCTSGEKSSKAQQKEEQYSKNAPTEKVKSNGNANGDATEPADKPAENGDAPAEETAAPETATSGETTGEIKAEEETKPEQATTEETTPPAADEASKTAEAASPAAEAASEDVELKIEEPGDKPEPEAAKTEASGETSAEQDSKPAETEVSVTTSPVSASNDDSLSAAVMSAINSSQSGLVVDTPAVSDKCVGDLCSSEVEGSVVVEIVPTSETTPKSTVECEPEIAEQEPIIAERGTLESCSVGDPQSENTAATEIEITSDNAVPVETIPYMDIEESTPVESEITENDLVIVEPVVLADTDAVSESSDVPIPAIEITPSCDSTGEEEEKEATEETTPEVVDQVEINSGVVDTQEEEKKPAETHDEIVPLTEYETATEPESQLDDGQVVQAPESEPAVATEVDIHEPEPPKLDPETVTPAENDLQECDEPDTTTVESVECEPSKPQRELDDLVNTPLESAISVEKLEIVESEAGVNAETEPIEPTETVMESPQESIECPAAAVEEVRENQDVGSPENTCTEELDEQRISAQQIIEADNIPPEDTRMKEGKDAANEKDIEPEIENYVPVNVLESEAKCEFDDDNTPQVEPKFEHEQDVTPEAKEDASTASLEVTEQSEEEEDLMNKDTNTPTLETDSQSETKLVTEQGETTPIPDTDAHDSADVADKADVEESNQPEGGSVIKEETVSDIVDDAELESSGNAQSVEKVGEATPEEVEQTENALVTEHEEKSPIPEVDGSDSTDLADQTDQRSSFDQMNVSQQPETAIVIKEEIVPDMTNETGLDVAPDGDKENLHEVEQSENKLLIKQEETTPTLEVDAFNSTDEAGNTDQQTSVNGMSPQPLDLSQQPETVNITKKEIVADPATDTESPSNDNAPSDPEAAPHKEEETPKDVDRDNAAIDVVTEEMDPTVMPESEGDTMQEEKKEEAKPSEEESKPAEAETKTEQQSEDTEKPAEETKGE